MKFSKAFRVSVIVTSVALLSTLQAAAQTSRIGNGNPATSKQLYGVAVLGRLNIEPGSPISFDHSCTVSLISPTRVMTATHCITKKFGDPQQGDLRYVLFSSNNRNPYQIIKNNNFRSIKEIEDAGITVRKIEPKNHIFPASFKRGSDMVFRETWNDLMFLSITPAVNSIKPLAIANRATVQNIKPGDKLKLAGFGYTSSNDDSTAPKTRPAVLQQAYLNAISSSQCKILQANFPNFAICTTPIKSTDGTQAAGCSGDSGAPLMVFNEETKRHEIVGVHSYSATNTGKCTSARVQAAMKPTAFAAWVDSVSKTGYSIK